MPFKSKAQVRACYARHDPRWNCAEFGRGQNISKLPEHVSDSYPQRYKKMHGHSHLKKNMTEKEKRRKRAAVLSKMSISHLRKAFPKIDLSKKRSKSAMVQEILKRRIH